MLRRATHAFSSRVSVQQSVYSALATRASRRNRSSFFQATQSDEIPLKGLTDSIAEAFGPALDAIAEEQRKRLPADAAEGEVYVPTVPHLLPVAKWASDSKLVRDVLIFDESTRRKPRMSWYDPYDTSWVPSGWFAQGIQGDMEYYFSNSVNLKSGPGVESNVEGNVEVRKK
uniref:Uncharacterized protein n=1 Tax=Mantoniella antarctica TaxID=81844 RepID=A0A7S0SQE7_9CHLO